MSRPHVRGVLEGYGAGIWLRLGSRCRLNSVFARKTAALVDVCTLLPMASKLASRLVFGLQARRHICVLREERWARMNWELTGNASKGARGRGSTMFGTYETRRSPGTGPDPDRFH